MSAKFVFLLLVAVFSVTLYFGPKIRAYLKAKRAEAAQDLKDHVSKL